jgi:hypothetical protein
MCSAIHINYRSWLRSSSTHEPSDPPHRIILSGFRKEEGATSHLLSRRSLPEGEEAAKVQATRDPRGAYTTPSTNRGREDELDERRARPDTTAGTSDPVRMATRVALTPRGDP